MPVVWLSDDARQAVTKGTLLKEYVIVSNNDNGLIKITEFLGVSLPKYNKSVFYPMY